MLLRLAFWAALLFAVVMAMWPLATPVPVAGLNDKWQHMLAFFTLSVLGGIAYRATGLGRILAGMALLGAGIEIAQLLLVTLNRTGSWLDLAADLAATAAGLAVAAALRFAIRSQEEPGRHPAG